LRSPYERESNAASGLIAAAAVAILLHAGGAWAVMNIDVSKKAAEEWVEMVVVEQEPPPEPEVEPEPEPEPEPEKPKPPPEPVEFEETVEPPPEPPPEKPKPRRMVQGLSTNSFVEGSGTGLAVRAGSTLSVKADEEGLELDDDDTWTDVPYASVTTKPRLRALPRLDVPQEAIDAEVEGTWTIWIDIDAEGRVTKALLKETIGYGIDEECVAKWRATRWKPGQRDGTPVAVNNIPMKCTIKALD